MSSCYLLDSPQDDLDSIYQRYVQVARLSIARFVREQRADHVMVLIAEVAPEHWWERVLFNRRGGVVARHVSASTNAVVCRLRYRLGRTSRPRQGAPAVAEAVPADR